MFKVIEKCPLCGSKKWSKIIKNNKNIYSFFLAKILNLNEHYILNNLKNFQCSNCTLIYKKKWPLRKYIKKIYSDHQPNHPGGLNTLKKNFGKKKLISLINKYKDFAYNKNYELCEKSKREIIKILNSTENSSKNFIKIKNYFIEKLNSDNIDYVNKNYLIISNMIKKPKIYSQFSGFRSNEISEYLRSTIKLKNINSYAEIGCPLWGNYDYFKKSWIKRYFIKINEVNFWKVDRKKKENCIKYLQKDIKVASNLNKIDFVGIYNFIDHLENPLRLFSNVFKDINYYGLICEDYNLSKKIDCQHFSSWNYKSLSFLSKKIGFKIADKPLRLGNSIYKYYILKKNDK